VAGPLDGALSRRTRHALRALASAWAAGVPSFDASARFIGELVMTNEASLTSQVWTSTSLIR
jgi:hypothetical protein